MEAMEFKSFFKTVGGNEGGKCKYPTRLDLYGCGCQHDCSYCYARSLLDFRKMWNPQRPRVADGMKVYRTIKRRIPEGSIVRLGGMTDCFQPMERENKATYNAIKEYLKLIDKTRKKVTVCEDVDEHFKFWRESFNPDKEDCCNLDKRR